MKHVTDLICNWHQDYNNNGPCEKYDSYKVGENGIISIIENQPIYEKDDWNYTVKQETNEGVQEYRIFNPNHVTYKITEE